MSSYADRRKVLLVARRVLFFISMWMRRPNEVLARMVVVSVACLTTAANATTYYVDRLKPGNDTNPGTTESSPFFTVRQCLSKLANPGDTCLVKNGTYPETNLGISRSGVAGNPITLANYPGHSPEIRRPDGEAPKLNGIYIGKKAGVVGWVVVRGLNVTNHTAAGIKYEGVHDLLVQSNRVHDNGSQGVLGWGTRVRIDRNIIYHNGRFVPCSKPETEWTCNQDHGIYSNGSDFKITNNVIYDNLAFGIQVNGNARYDSTKHPGPEYVLTSKWLIANNTIAYQNNRAAITLWSLVSNFRIENNIFYENCSKCPSSSVQGINMKSGVSGISIKNNLSFQSGAGGRGFLDSLATEGVDYTQSGNLVDLKPPGFVNGPQNLPTTPNFALTAQSPALSAGLNLYASDVKTDFLGRARPTSGPFDLGAYEYGPVPVATVPSEPAQFSVR